MRQYWSVQEWWPEVQSHGMWMEVETHDTKAEADRAKRFLMAPGEKIRVQLVEIGTVRENGMVAK